MKVFTLFFLVSAHLASAIVLTLVVSKIQKKRYEQALTYFYDLFFGAQNPTTTPASTMTEKLRNLARMEKITEKSGNIPPENENREFYD